MPSKVTEIQSLFREFQTIEFESKSAIGSRMNWNASGRGFVTVFEAQNILEFHEKIKLENGINCEDQKNWIFRDDVIIFQRFNYGKLENIFEFERVENGQFAAKKIFHCAPDFYNAFLEILPRSAILKIEIRGTKKNEILRYVYT